jgi:hypothetical protein
MFGRLKGLRTAQKARREDRVMSRRERRKDVAKSHAARVDAQSNGPTQIGRGASS